MALSNKLSFSLWVFILTFLAIADASATLSCKTREDAGLNVIDRCWRTSPNYAARRSWLATCSVGFAGKMLKNRGSGLKRYQVTNYHDDPVNPKPGTLRYGATLIPGKVWITFKRDMKINLKRPLMVSSLTTIDGRGANVCICQGDGFLLRKVKNVIIHGLHFHHNKPTPAGQVISPGGMIQHHGKSDGDAIGIVTSSKVWIDHNTLSQGRDGLIDVTHGSTNITISNNWFLDHDKVMLLGHTDSFSQDRVMKVTIVFNKFGPNCNQRMPRIRYGYAHVVNNLYDGWKEYAIGGSMHPLITSQANIYVASKNNKEIVRKMSRKGNGGEPWSLKSEDDAFVNGALFRQENKARNRPRYGPEEWFPVASTEEVRSLTKDSGALHCHGKIC